MNKIVAFIQGVESWVSLHFHIWLYFYDRNLHPKKLYVRCVISEGYSLSVIYLCFFIMIRFRSFLWDCLLTSYGYRFLYCCNKHIRFPPSSMQELCTVACMFGNLLRRNSVKFRYRCSISLTATV